MKPLVTGGAGFLGSNLVERLLERYDRVAVLDDLSAGKLSNLDNSGRVDLSRGSVTDVDLVRSLVKDAGIVFHLATPCLVKGLEDPELMHSVSDTGTFNVCMAAKEANAKVVYVSTSEIYGIQERFPIREDAKPNPVSIYGLTKLMGERYVQFFHAMYGLPAVVIRPFNFYGPRAREDAYGGVITNFLKCKEAGEPPVIQGDGLQERDLTHVTDVVDGVMLLSELEGGEVVNLGTGRAVSLLYLASLVYGTIDAKPVFVEPRVRDIRKLQADIGLAKGYGYSPKLSLEAGLRKYAEWFRQRL